MFANSVTVLFLWGWAGVGCLSEAVSLSPFNISCSGVMARLGGNKEVLKVILTVAHIDLS